MKQVLIITTALLYLGTTIPALAQSNQGRQAGGRRATNTLSVGDLAPDFKLSTRDGRQAVRLSSLRGRRPVVLIFGSYT